MRAEPGTAVGRAARAAPATELGRSATGQPRTDWRLCFRVMQVNFCEGESITTTDSVFRRALSNMLAEVFDGPPGQEAYLLNPGDPGLLRQLDTIDASAASKRPMPGKTTIAAHVDHVHFGLSILNRWAAGEANPWAGADWNASWQRATV